MDKQLSVALINGQNLSNLGRRDERIVGAIASLAELDALCERVARLLDIDLVTYQSNHEGDILEFIHQMGDGVDAYVINPGGLNLTGEATRQALHDTGRPIVELHFANVAASGWEDFTVFTRSATALAMGLREHSYVGALFALAALLRDESYPGTSAA